MSNREIGSGGPFFCRLFRRCCYIGATAEAPQTRDKIRRRYRQQRSAALAPSCFFHTPCGPLLLIHQWLRGGNIARSCLASSSLYSSLRRASISISPSLKTVLQSTSRLWRTWGKAESREVACCPAPASTSIRCRTADDTRDSDQGEDVQLRRNLGTP